MSTWFAETRLAWMKESIELFGFLNREHVMRKFNVSAPQASHDFRVAQTRWPRLFRYNASAKRYEPC